MSANEDDLQGKMILRRRYRAVNNNIQAMNVLPNNKKAQRSFQHIYNHSMQLNRVNVV